MPQYECHLPDTQRAQHTLVAKNAAGHVPVREQARLKGQKGSGRIHQVNHRQPIFNGNIQRADHFLYREGIPGSPLDRAVAGQYYYFAAADDANTCHYTGTRHGSPVGHVGGEGGEF